ncbi:interleukin-1 receptor-like 1 [Clarias gariepinus]
MAEISMIICFLAELLMASASIDYSVQCESTQDVHTVRVIQGEALRLPCSNLECSEETNNSLIFWFKNGSNGIQPITTGETERVHAHGPVLYFLPLSLNDTGGQLELNCLVFFGININDVPSVYWMRNNSRLNSNYSKNKDGIKSSFKITQVSETDLQSNYCCIAMSAQKWEFVCISLSTRESLTPVVVMFSCMLLFLLLAAAILKWFTVDLVLCFRSFGIMQSKRNDGKVYDAYVIYQKDNLDEKTERKVAHFVNKVLPAVLENTCGFKLYIQGRDDLPGEGGVEHTVLSIALSYTKSCIHRTSVLSEKGRTISHTSPVPLPPPDCSELTETSMQLSRRLIAVLPLGLSRHHRVTTSLCYDWHVGLHQVVVEQEMKAILIQLGDMDDFSHLPMGLQHLLQKTPPLRWDEGSGQALCPTSRFWKQVRYMMPVPPDSRSRGVASPR